MRREPDMYIPPYYPPYATNPDICTQFCVFWRFEEILLPKTASVAMFVGYYVV